ncbi:hypothetical protein JCM8097_001703 [Rhodosporidiobolus ruineniae]
MADWSQLKAKRAQRQPLASSSSSRASPGPPAASKEEQRKPDPDAPVLAAGEVVDYQHADFPSSNLEVRRLPGRGRGVVTKRTLSAGTTLLTTSPLLSALDNHNLGSRCSFCFRSQDDTEHQKPLLQCSLCHTIQYCSATCQSADWKLHKKECAALRAASKQAGRRIVPDTPIRALARLLWKKELESDKLWQDFESLESHRDELTSEEQERFFQLSVALTQYMGSQEAVASAVGGSGRGMMDLCSRFTSNSFSLTSPADVTNLGVSISPLTALFNHSCAPNAVVVFPRFPSPSQPKHMAVVAVREIKPGEEVVTSYVDVALPREVRRKELRERYKFECGCEECERGEVDPREALECPKKGCCGLISLPPRSSSSPPSAVTCPTCSTSHPYQDVYPALDAASQALKDAEAAQYSDPKLAFLHLEHLITALTSSLSPSPPLAASSHPLLPARHLLLTLRLHSALFPGALQTARLLLPALRVAYSPGHPVLAVHLSTLARLETMPPPPEAGPAAELSFWADEGARAAGISRAVEALREAERAFGREGKGGGEMGERLRRLIRDQEEGVAMARRVRDARRGGM